MKQLPGRQPPRWWRILLTAVTTTVGTIWLLSLLPFLLLLTLVFGILMIPVLRRLRSEMDQVNAASGVQPSTGQEFPGQRSTVDVTPWHRQLSLLIAQLRNSSSAMRR